VTDAAQKDPEDIFTYSTADIQATLMAISAKRSGLIKK